MSGLDGLDRAVIDLPQLDLRPWHLHLAVRDAANVQEIVYQTGQLHGLPLHDGDTALLRGRALGKRSSSSPVRIGASGLRSSWARSRETRPCADPPPSGLPPPACAR